MYSTFDRGVWTYLNLEFPANRADFFAVEASELNQYFKVKN
jgi:hypothetical protein